MNSLNDDPGAAKRQRERRRKRIELLVALPFGAGFAWLAYEYTAYLIAGLFLFWALASLLLFVLWLFGPENPTPHPRPRRTFTAMVVGLLCALLLGIDWDGED